MTLCGLYVIGTDLIPPARKNACGVSNLEYISCNLTYERQFGGQREQTIHQH